MCQRSRKHNYLTGNISTVLSSQVKGPLGQSPEKCPQIHALASSKSPVKLRNFKLDDRGNDLIITKHTKIDPLARENIPFAISEELASTGDPIKLSLIHTLAAEQLISVKGHVSRISAVKIVSTHKTFKTLICQSCQKRSIDVSGNLHWTKNWICIKFAARKLKANSKFAHSLPKTIVMM